jgi:hypothetical protein
MAEGGTENVMVDIFYLFLTNEILMIRAQRINFSGLQLLYVKKIVDLKTLYPILINLVGNKFTVT